MAKTKMLLITHSFPYGEAEKTFLAPEVKILEEFFDVSIISRNITDAQSTKVSPSWTLFRYNPKQGYSVAKLLMETIIALDFWKECIYLFKNGKFQLPCLKQTLSIYMRTIHFKNYLQTVAEVYHDRPIVFYTYWNGYETLACQKIKRPCDVVVTRTHGGDLYLKSDNNYYQPYKDITNRTIDRIYFISNDGLHYYQNTFRYLGKEQVALSRLGVFPHDFRNSLPDDGIIHIFSLSRLFWVKRIDKLIESLGEISNHKIEWVHIGDGELHDEIYQKANILLGKKNNIVFRFLGNLDNTEVFSLLKSHPMDFIINTSYSEGLPVSIMEAMSCGIPAIAVKVGGIPEIVIHKKTGYLIGRDFTAADIQTIFSDYSEMTVFEKSQMRENAYKMWNTSYNASCNHRNFARNILSLLERKK